MDKHKTIYTAVTSAGLPCVYRAWPEGEAPSLPFVCYLERGSDNFAADNSVYLDVDSFDVELYTKEKDPSVEATLEAALSSFVWEKTETYIDTERCYQIVYSFEL